MCEGVCSPCENVHMRALYCVLLSVGGCQDPEDPAVPGINGCSRGVYKNITEVSPDLVYPPGH